MSQYRVELPDFHGPLDLLLHLVKRNEIDIRNIPMASVVEQFRVYLNVLQAIDVESVGDFLMTAAMLLEIKSRMLLPQSESAADAEQPGDDPRQELVKQLLDYRRFREASMRLEALASNRERRFERAGPVGDAAPTADGRVTYSIELWDLLSSFGRLLAEAQPDDGGEVEDDTPQQVYCERVVEKLRSRGRMPFVDMFERPLVRMRLIGMFLAILELIKARTVILESADDVFFLSLASAVTP